MKRGYVVRGKEINEGGVRVNEGGVRVMAETKRERLS